MRRAGTGVDLNQTTSIDEVELEFSE